MGAEVPKRQLPEGDWGVFGSVDAAIAKLAARQRGVVTRGQLLKLGLGRNAIGGRLRSGRLHRLYRGVYLVGHAAPMPGARELGAVLACGTGAVLSHRSAAVLWHLLPSLPRDITVTVAGRDCRGPDGIKVHRVTALSRRQIRKLGPIPITSPARTLLDIAPTVPARQLEQAVAEAQSRRLVRHNDLTALLALGPRAGVAALRPLLDTNATPSLTRSEAEERFLGLIRDAGLPPPESNVVIENLEVDFLWRDARLIVEVDGFAFRSSRTAFERDRARDAVLAAAGYRVIRVTWRQIVNHPEALIARITAALRA